MIALLPSSFDILPLPSVGPLLRAPLAPQPRPDGRGQRRIVCGDEPDDSDDDLGDEEDLTTAPSVDEESSFDDFDDDFDDDFEEEENDPDWDHPEENDPLPPTPSKGPSKKK
jgi:hypothetical protein